MSSSCFSLTQLLGLNSQKNRNNKIYELPKSKSNIFLVKNFCKQSEEIVDENKVKNLTNEINIDFAFYEELRENEYLLNKIKKRIEVLKHEKGFCKNNPFNERSIDCLELNINFLIQVIKLFCINKFTSNKRDQKMNTNEADFNEFNEENKNEKQNFRKSQKIFLLQKIQIIKLYFYTIIKLKNLRVKYGDFHYTTIDEGNRFINSLRKFFFLKYILKEPSKMGLIYLRTLKFFLWKILKSLRDELSDKMNLIKLGFYVTKINFFCYLSADFLILKENNLFEKTYADKRWKDIYKNLHIEVKIFISSI
jgi:hypothetical protein